CNGLEVAQGGTIETCGQWVVAHGTPMTQAGRNRLRMRVGMVFQSFSLFPLLSVLDNVTVGPRTLLGMSRPAAEAQAAQLLAKVGLSDKMQAMPASLSGRQKRSEERRVGKEGR